MAISERVRRLLLARSGGYCMRPECRRDLFAMFECGDITSVEELAHIVGEKVQGPRGDRALPLNRRDEYHNILVLCPCCHTLIDKHPKQFPNEMLLVWKANHEAEIAKCFGASRFQNRAELNAAISALLIENRVTFETYGPFSESPF
jgi:hypothetical protein